MADFPYQPHASSSGSPWLPEYAYTQPVNMQDWARAFPRPRHSRVMKPRSAGNSPSAMTRRRTATTQSVMHGPSNQYQSSLEAALLASAVPNTRPISWHPSSARSRGLSNPTCVPEFPEQYSAMGTMPDQTLNMNALSVYGSDSMLSYPLSAGAAVSPDSYIPFYLDSQDPMALPQQTPTLSIPSSQVGPMAWDTNQVDMSAISQTSDGWSLDMLPMANIPPPVTTCPSYASVPSPGEMSGPSTPDFLPIQQFSPLAQEKKDSKPEEELVGMGLYSQPDGTSSQSQQQGLLGKGLKLEETFSPSDDEKDEGSQDDNDDGDVDELEPVPQQTQPQQSAPVSHQSSFSMPKQHMKPALNLLHKSFFFDHDDLDQQVVPSAQPFPGLNQSCMSYGYGWI